MRKCILGLVLVSLSGCQTASNQSNTSSNEFFSITNLEYLDTPIKIKLSPNYKATCHAKVIGETIEGESTYSTSSRWLTSKHKDGYKVRSTHNFPEGWSADISMEMNQESRMVSNSITFNNIPANLDSGLLQQLKNTLKKSILEQYIWGQAYQSGDKFLPDKIYDDAENFITAAMPNFKINRVQNDIKVLGRKIIDGHSYIIASGKIFMNASYLNINGNAIADNIFAVDERSGFFKKIRISSTVTAKSRTIYKEVHERNCDIVPTKAEQQLYSSTDKRSLAVQWEGYGNLISGIVEETPDKNGGIVNAILPNNDGTCKGRYNHNGTWNIACTNGLAASGTFKNFGSGKGASGVGVDAFGRRVVFTMGGKL